MIHGIFAGITWALETVFLGIALNMSPFISTEKAVFMAPFISTFLHDLFSGIIMLIYNTLRGNFKNLCSVFKLSDFKWLVIASTVGGPVGMTGYVLTVNFMGASVGAVASAVYPAIGTVLAYVFLKEKVKWHQWIFLGMTMIGVYGLSYSPGFQIKNFWIGIFGAFMCAFGWGIEAVILAKCLKNPNIKNEYVLNIRQITSAMIYGLIILPVLKGGSVTIEILKGNSGLIIPTIAIAALFASISYMFYYRAIVRIGAAKAMALNITYTAWAIIFSVLILKDKSMLNPLTIGCAAIVVICGIFAATDIKKLFKVK